MGNVSKRFFILLFELILMLIVLINYLGWSGAYINIATGSGVDWSNSYFGFNSLWGFFYYIDYFMNLYDFLSVKAFIEHLNELQNTILFRLPLLYNVIMGAEFNVWDVLVSIGTILFQPLILIGWMILILIHVVWYALCVIGGLLAAFSGYYNVPMSPLPNMWEYTSQAMMSYVA